MQQQGPGPAQPGVDVVAAIQMGVINQTLPAHGGPGLFEINPHHHLQIILELVVRLGDGGGVLLGGRHVMDRARTDYHQQPLISRMQNRLDPFAGTLHGAGSRLGNRQLRVQHRRRHQGPGFDDVKIGGGDHERQTPWQSGNPP